MTAEVGTTSALVVTCIPKVVASNGAFVCVANIMKVENYVKLSLLKYPTLYKNRLDVLVHVFAVIGNGLEWVNGELVSRNYDGSDAITDARVESGEFTMRYNDLDEDEERDKETAHYECLNELHYSRAINREFERMRRALTFKHIDHIAKHNDAAVIHWEPNLKGKGHYIECPYENTAKLFFVPDDVQEGWGLAALEFAKHWRYFFMQKYQGFALYGNASKTNEWLDGYTNNWPYEMKTAYKFVAHLQTVMDDICVKIGIETESESNPKWADEMKKARELPL